MNSDLKKSLGDVGSFDSRHGDAVFVAFCNGASRRELAKRFNISYPTVCRVIAKRQKKQDPLF